MTESNYTVSNTWAPRANTRLEQHVALVVEVRADELRRAGEEIAHTLLCCGVVLCVCCVRIRTGHTQGVRTAQRGSPSMRAHTTALAQGVRIQVRRKSGEAEKQQAEPETPRYQRITPVHGAANAATATCR